MITEAKTRGPEISMPVGRPDTHTLVDRPIFFVGAPRSGTTILFEAFSAHEDLAWFSNYSHKFPRYPILSVISRLAYNNDFMGSKKQNGESAFRLPRPYAAECYPAWELCCGEKFRFDFLIDAKATESEKEKVIQLAHRIMKYQGKPRFVAKITGPTRISYLNSIFPDAIFIHVIRDGRAVANSLMKVSWWKQGGGYDRPWWRNGLTDQDFDVYQRYDKSPIVLTAIEWRRIMLVARQEAAAIDPSRYLEVRYEDALQDPFSYMDKLADFSQLPRSKKVHDYITRKTSLTDMNFKFSKDLKASDIKLLDEVIGDVNRQFGYK
jgi:hypothetical protein